MQRLAAILLVLAFATPASAQYLEGSRGFRTPDQGAPEVFGYENLPFERDRGMLLRLTLAPTWMTTYQRSVGFGIAEGVRLEGGGVDAAATVGGVVRHGLAVHGTVAATALIEPRVTVGQASASAGTLGALRVGIAPGLTGYLPSNVWGSASLGAALVSVDFDGGRELVNPSLGYGLYFEASAGKEWWLNGYGSLGLFGKIATHRVVNDYDGAFGGVSLSIGLSATFN